MLFSYIFSLELLLFTSYIMKTPQRILHLQSYFLLSSCGYCLSLSFISLYINNASYFIIFFLLVQAIIIL